MYSSVIDLINVRHKLKRGLWYILTGNWRQRLLWEKAHRERQIRTVKWDYLTKFHSYFDYTLQPGIYMRIYGDSELCRLIYVENFESQERQFLNMFLRPGDIFVDIGANIGLFTLIAAQRVGKTGKVYSFEPAFKAFERLQINVQLNEFSNTCCCQIALSDHPGKAVMYIANDSHDAWNSLSRPLSSESVFTENIETITFDEFVQENQLTGKVTMVKIDVEGWESHVLSGGVGTFSRPDAPVLQVEFTEENARQAGTSCRNLYEQLVGLGYALFTYDKKLNSLVPCVVRDYYAYSNLIACKHQEYIATRLNNIIYCKQC